MFHRIKGRYITAKVYFKCCVKTTSFECVFSQFFKAFRPYRNNIVFLHSAKSGDTLIAEAVEVFNHHKIPYVDVRITNQQGVLCCVVTGMAYRKAADLPIDGLE